MIEINLFQSFYEDKSEARNNELAYCFNHNQYNKLFKRYIQIQGIRPTFNDVFKMTQDYPNCLNVIANSDIYFHESFGRIREINWREKLCLALGKWDLMKTGQLLHMAQPDSQDCWVFYGAAPQIEGADFYVGGVAGCDNVIAYLLEQYGYSVFNPSNDLKCIHYHISRVRNYASGKTQATIERLPPPYKLLHPCNLSDVK